MLLPKKTCFKFYIGSTEKDVKNRIGLAWAAFAKLKPILTSYKTKAPLKMRLFDAACISNLLYGCESWLLSSELTNKLYVIAGTCYRIILGSTRDRSRTPAQVYWALPATPSRRASKLVYTLYEYKINIEPKLGRPRRTPKTSFQLPGPKRWAFSPCGRNCQIRQEKVG